MRRRSMPFRMTMWRIEGTRDGRRSVRASAAMKRRAVGEESRAGVAPCDVARTQRASPMTATRSPLARTRTARRSRRRGRAALFERRRDAWPNVAWRGTGARAVVAAAGFAKDIVVADIVRGRAV